MNIHGIIFDLNGTLIDIHTDEGHGEIYRVLANLLSYQGILLTPETLRDRYFQIMKEQRRASTETYPEFDAVSIFETIIFRHASDFTRALPPGKRRQLPLFLAEVFRAVSRFRLRLYPGVEETLATLQGRYRLAALTDAQNAWAIPELHAVGLLDLFSPVVVSGDLGFRKPDPRIFQQTLDDLEMLPDEVLFVGNDMYRDVYGAQQLGLKTIFFRSNQGEQQRDGVEPDYIIYQFPELLQAIEFFRHG